MVDYINKGIRERDFTVRNYTGPDLRTDVQFLQDNIEIDMDRSIKVLKNVLLKAREELHLVDSEHLAYQDMYSDDEPIDFENFNP